jgi:hypothetical protein
MTACELSPVLCKAAVKFSCARNFLIARIQPAGKKWIWIEKMPQLVDSSCEQPFDEI